MDNPFEMYVTDGRMQNRQPIGGIVEAEFTPKFNALGTGTFSLQDDDPLNRRLLTDDARVIVRYKGEHLMSGKVRSPSGKITPGGTVQYSVQDDWRWLVNTIAWVQPVNGPMPTALAATAPDAMGQAWLPGGASDAGADGTIQGQYGYYLWPNGSGATGGDEVHMTESAVKRLIDTNFQRLNRYYAQFPQLSGFLARNYAIATDQLRGVDHVARGDLPQVRFGTLEDYVVPLLTTGGLGLRLAQPIDGPVLVEVYTPGVRSQKLTVASGAVTDGDWTYTSPNGNLAVVGGPGDLAARMFQQYSSPAAGDVASLLPELDVIEVYKEASSGQIDWPATLSDAYRVEKYAPLRADVAAASYADALATMAAAGADALADGAATSGTSVTLSETKWFTYGGPNGAHLGDTVTIATGDDRELEFTDRITECSLKLSTSDGFTVTPVVGAKTLDPNLRFARAIVRLARTLHLRSASQ